MMQQSQYRKSGEIVEKIGRILGVFHGYRSLHASGHFYKGVFRPNALAAEYSRAPHFQLNEVPVTVRYSKGGGDPFAHFSATVGMATRFYLPDGAVTNLVMLSQKLFIANTVEQFLGLLEAALPDEGAGGAAERGGGPNINREGLQKFLAANPNSMAVFKMRAASPAPVSFATTQFHSVHAFYFLSAADVATPARCHWTPVAGIQGQPVENLGAQDIDVLYEEMGSRLQQGPVEFDLQLELAEPGDPLNDATALWPEGRRWVTIGRLTLEGTVAEGELRDKVMNHDPTVLTDGIEPTDDPILQIRRGVYEISAAHRSGGWKL